MISDSAKGLEMSYNLANLPGKVQKTDSTDMATFRYLSDGTKVAAVRSDGTRLRYMGSSVGSGRCGAPPPEYTISGGYTRTPGELRLKARPATGCCPSCRLMRNR